MLITNPSQANVSCSAVNRVGEGIQDSTAIQAYDNNIIIIVVIDIINILAIMIKIMTIIITVQVSAPPAFIQSLGPYTGFTAASTNVSLLCQVSSMTTLTMRMMMMMVPAGIPSLLCQISMN